MPGRVGGSTDDARGRANRGLSAERQGRPRTGTRAVVAFAVSVGALVLAAGRPPPAPIDPATLPPNVILIVTDDQSVRQPSLASRRDAVAPVADLRSRPDGLAVVPAGVPEHAAVLPVARHDPHRADTSHHTRRRGQRGRAEPRRVRHARHLARRCGLRDRAHRQVPQRVPVGRAVPTSRAAGIGGSRKRNEAEGGRRTTSYGRDRPGRAAVRGRHAGRVRRRTCLGR